MSRFIAASDSVLNDLNQTSDYPASDCTDNTRLVYHIQLIEILLKQTFCVLSAKGHLISKANWRARFSQKTKGRICFVCFFTLHGKQIKFVRLFFW